jgi:hypothetical protein
MHGGGGAIGGGGGMESIVPQTGKGTAFLGIGLFGGLIWGWFKHPRMMLGASGCALVIMSLAGFPDIMAHPVIGWLLMITGACWGMGGNDKRNAALRKASDQAYVDRQNASAKAAQAKREGMK